MSNTPQRTPLLLGQAPFLAGIAICLVIIPFVDFNEHRRQWATAPFWTVVVLLCAARLRSVERQWFIAALPPALFFLGWYLEVTISARDFPLIADEGGPLTPFGTLLRNGWWLAQLLLIAWIGFLRGPNGGGKALSTKDKLPLG